MGCACEIDAYTYVNTPDGRAVTDALEATSELERAGALCYFTSDGGQAYTGNPFVFADKVLDVLSCRLSPALIRRLAVDGPAAMVERLEGGRS
jgi:hypothetical protein